MLGLVSDTRAAGPPTPLADSHSVAALHDLLHAAKSGPMRSRLVRRLVLLDMHAFACAGLRRAPPDLRAARGRQRSITSYIQ